MQIWVIYNPQNNEHLEVAVGDKFIPLGFLTEEDASQFLLENPMIDAEVREAQDTDYPQVGLAGKTAHGYIQRASEGLGPTPFRH